MIKKKKILIIAAHPDDEILGCGGTIIKLKDKCEIFTIFMTDGVSARGATSSKKEKQIRKRACIKLFEFLKIKKPIFLNLPDNQLDKLPLLKIVKKIEKHLFKIDPDEVFTHYENCLNIDHKITFQATITACRPIKNLNIKKILSFEIPSSTDWSLSKKKFNPNYFVNITNQISKKINALKYYKMELRKDPHSRSLNSIKALSKFRGASSGVMFAEAFYINRIIEN